MNLTLVAKDPNSVPDGSPALYRTDRQSWIVQGWVVTDPAALAALNLPEGETCVEIPDRLIPYFADHVTLRPSSLEELSDLCRGIATSFVHLETRDAYGTETELPHLAKWRRGETRRLRVAAMVAGDAPRPPRRRPDLPPRPDRVRATQRLPAMGAQPRSLFIDAGEDIRYVPRPRLTTTLLPGSGDFYVFDDTTVLFLHYAGTGTNTSFEITDDPQTASTCARHSRPYGN